MEVLDQLWNEVKEQLSDTLPTGASMLLSRVELKNIEEGVALITAQSKFVLDSIKDYKTVIENVLSVKMGENITVSIEVSSDTKISEKDPLFLLYVEIVVLAKQQKIYLSIFS